MIWESEKEALQSRLTKRREGMFRCLCNLFSTHARAIVLFRCLFCSLPS